jgi:hypothetical protein
MHLGGSVSLRRVVESRDARRRLESEIL